jgi:carboxyl-terminal processing protease
MPSGRSLQARGVTPDIQVLQTEPEDALTQDAPISEAELHGHLKSEGAEKSGSQTFVPSEPKDDRALQKALGLLRGTDAQVLPLPSRQEQATR